MHSRMEYTLESIVITASLVVFVLQHLGRRFDIPWIKVSFYLGWIVWVFRTLARSLGVVYGYIATFPSLVQFWEIYNTFREIVQPIWEMINIPFDYRDAVFATAEKVASIEHMRVGTIILAWLGFMWWRGYMEELYFGVIGIMVGIMVLTHLVAEAIQPHKDGNPDNSGDTSEEQGELVPATRSPPSRRRGKSQAIVPTSRALRTR